jgi:tetratricopeptide (TPR) repeat protein
MTYVQDYSFYEVMSNMKKYCKTRALAAVFLLFFLAGLPAIDYFAEGERLFRQNRPEEAIPLLYQASLQEGTDPRVFVFLGLSYQQAGKNADAVSTFIRGTSVAGTNRKVLYFNAGNVYFSQEAYSEAVTMYTRSLENDSAFAPAYLHRANARVKLEHFPQAVEDYRMYLTLDPASWQSDSIRQLMALLEGEIRTQEERALREEAERLATEAERKAEEERYRRLMDEVSSSLQEIDQASTLSAGSESIQLYDEEGDLE